MLLQPSLIILTDNMRGLKQKSFARVVGDLGFSLFRDGLGSTSYYVMSSALNGGVSHATHPSHHTASPQNFTASL